MPNTQALIGGQGIDVQPRLRPLPPLLPVAGEHADRRVHAQPRGARQHRAVRRLGAVRSRTSRTPSPPGLHDDGYYNVHIGKYMNGYASGAADPAARPAGLGRVVRKGLRGPPLLQLLADREGRGRPTRPSSTFYGDQTDEYQTDVLRDKAVDFIDTATDAETPFMMNVWFNAPHGPFDPAPRHLFTQSSAALPKLQAFNEKDISDKPKWLRKQARKRLSKGLKQTIASERRRRLEQLLSVDEAVGGRSSPSSPRRASSTTPTSSSPRTTASSGASTGSRAASTSPTSPPPACR